MTEAKQLAFQGAAILILSKEGMMASIGSLNDPAVNYQVGVEKVIMGKSPTHFMQISAGAQHCAAISANGMLYTWGDNRYGACGFNYEKSARAYRPAPNRFDDPLPSHHFEYPKQVACGVSFTAFIDKDGKLFVAGIVPTRKEDLHVHRDEIFLWRHIEHAKKIVKISAHANLLIVLNEDGEVYGPTQDPEAGCVDVQLKHAFKGRKWRDIAAGAYLLLLSEDGHLYRRDSKVKNDVIPIEGPWEYVRHIASGSSSAFIDNLGRLWTFGSNECGQLGLGYKSEKGFVVEEPQLVRLDKPVLRVFLGASSMGYLM